VKEAKAKVISFVGASSSQLFWFILIAWSAMSVVGASRSAFGGHADATNTLTVAKNLLAGNGFTVNYVWAFFHLRPIPHPEDTWPLFYPTLVAISMAIFGNNPLGWRVPNILLVVLTTFLVRRISLEIFKQRSIANLTGVLYLALGPSDTISIFNNTLLTFLFVLACYLAAKLTLRPTGGRMFRLGLSFGALLLAKPDSVFVVAGISLGIVLLFLLEEKSFDRAAIFRPLYRVALPLVIALALWSPWLCRNYIVFGDPLFAEPRSLRIFHRHNNEVFPHEEAYAVRPPPEISEIIHRYDGVLPWLWTEGTIVYDGARRLLFSELGLLAFASLMIAASERHWTRFEIRLVGVSLAGFICHAGFLLLHFYYVKRYFFPYLPILLVFVIGHVVQRVRGVSTLPRLVYSAAITVVVLVLAVPQAKQLIKPFRHGLPVPPDVEWIRKNIPPDSRVMTRDPWESYFHTEREAVMIPWGPLQDVKRIMKLYEVRYLVLRKPSRRPEQLEALLQKNEDGIVKVFEADSFVVFRADFERCEEGGIVQNEVADRDEPSSADFGRHAVMQRDAGARAAVQALDGSRGILEGAVRSDSGGR
jgi:Dolichyl-phosphate-mannose-protein mannosyltransferase